MTHRRILIRVGRPPHRPVNIEAAHAYRAVGTFSTNTGNLLFQDAVYRALATPSTELVVDSLSSERRGVDGAHIERINSEFDALVLPLANAFREDFLTPLNRLSKVVERLRIPVIVTGVGAQLPLDGDPRAAGTAIDEATTRFVRAVLERSASVGVRGDLTRDYLIHLGFEADRIDIIGCPSMHLAGPEATVGKNPAGLTADSRVALNLTPGVDELRAFLELNHERYPHLTYVAQDNEMAGLLLWGEEFEAPPGMPGTMDHYLYREDRIRLFADPQPWLDFLAGCDFACGSRIHGNVAALMAGTPAFLLAHDSRTLELARFHGIPHGAVDGFAADELDLATLYERTDLAEFNRLRGPNHARWLEFLERNDLAHTWADPNPGFEAELAATTYPGPARPITSATPQELAQRLRWLRQGVDDGDRLRTHRAYQPEFVPEAARPSNVAARLRQERERTAELGEQVARQAKEIEALTKVVERHTRKLSQLKPTIPQRLARKLGLGGGGR
ncbi:MAG TPA: polysaccharide pyruvyl transferase family protein [Propionicimonas sp.]|jgi:uncharacterized coiled-coil protein SlyX|nr:polysaccharide pyruvyl transferase family protein [Propionicimonas sp.]